jgi:subtilisin family serine protease
MSEYKKYVIVKNVDLPPDQKYNGLSKDDEYEHLYTLDTLGIPMGEVEMTDEEKEYVENLPQVKFVEEVKTYSVPKPDQPDGDFTTRGEGSIRAINANVAHDKGYKGKGVKVADLDTGLDNTWADRLRSQNQLVAIADFTNSSSGTNDRQGHGTHTAGTIYEVAPEALFIIGKVLGDNGSGSTSGIIKGISWAIEQGAQVINQSLGAFPDSDAVNDSLSLAVNAARDKGVLMPCAAGNDQDSHPNRDCANETSPGAAARAICVAATDDNKNIARFSNKGSVVDIAAPGVNVTSWGLNGRSGASMSGTSMATPHVAGALTVLLSAASDPDKVETALYKGSTDTGLPLDREGNGFLNVSVSLSLLLETEEPVEEYKPHLDRVGLYTFNHQRGEYFEKRCVLTTRAEGEIGAFFPKPKE